MNITNIHAKTSFYVSKNVINDNFVRDLARIPVITAEEERKCFIEIEASKRRVKKAKNTSNYKHVMEVEEKLQLDLRNKIIEGNQRLNYAAAKRYDNNEIIMELVSIGTIGMIEAFKEYDYTVGTRFGTYAMYYIKRAINAFLNKDNMTIRSSNDTKILPKVKKIENEFYLKEGFMPSSEYIKEALYEQYSIDNIDSLDLISAEVTSIDAPVTSDDETYTLSMDDSYNSITSYENNYMEEIEMESKRNLIERMFKTLSDREKIILSMSMGYNYDREYKDNEIADEIGLTSERVRQIKLPAIKKLQKFTVARY